MGMGYLLEWIEAEHLEIVWGGLFFKMSSHCGLYTKRGKERG